MRRLRLQGAPVSSGTATCPAERDRSCCRDGNLGQEPRRPLMRVYRQWVPRLGAETLRGRFHRRFRQTARRTSDAADVDPGCALDVGEGIVAAILVLVVILVAIFVLIPLVIALVEIVGLLLLGVALLASRVLLRRPWVIEAATDEESRYEWRVVGWQASGAAVAELARHLQAGLDPASFDPR